MSEVNLEDVIKDAVDNAVDSDEREPEVQDSTQDASSASDDTEKVASESEESAAPAEESAEVASPAARTTETPAQDDFAKKHGLQPQVPGQRENRLPYSRVKKIVENAEKKATEPFTAQLAERDTKLKDYEERLTQVGKFEQLMLGDRASFLKMLSERVPGYAEVLAPLFQAAAPQAATPAAKPGDDMPQPDTQLPDGSAVYSMEGLKALMAWNAKQVQTDTMKQVESKYDPIRQEWEAHQRMQALIPQVQKQIDDAREWPSFKENEDEITKALEANVNLSLEGAYRQVVFPKLVSEKSKLRDEVRKEVLAELKKAPATSAPSSQVKPRAEAQGPRTLEQVIKDSIDAAGLRA